MERSLVENLPHLPELSLRRSEMAAFESGVPSSKRMVPEMVAPLRRWTSAVEVRLGTTATGVRRVVMRAAVVGVGWLRSWRESWERGER